MNKKLDAYKRYIRYRKVAVLGIGVSNTPLIKYLAAMGVKVTAFDMVEEGQLGSVVDELRALGVKLHLGKDYLNSLHGFDTIFKTPKVRYDIPELVAERERGAEITSEMEVFLELCPCEVFAVTGSDGKTTTTTLIYRMLTEAGFKCWLGGNIGTPLLDRIDEIQETDKVVLELSSFQLQTMHQSPHIAVVTNLSPNHLDVHKSMEEYIDAKKNIFRHQNSSDMLVLNYDNEITRSFAPDSKGEVIYFSRTKTLTKGAFLRNDTMVYYDGNETCDIVRAQDILLLGHNIGNYLAAIAAVKDYVGAEAIRKVATTFTGVEHRMELVRTLNGITFYNDSMASSPSRTIAGLKAINKKVILIAGGYDKNIPYDEIGEVIIDKVKCLVLIGATAPKIEAALNKEVQRSGRGKDITVHRCSTLEEAVITAYKNAYEGDAVVLSPASASFDMFKDFAEKGNKFKEYVYRL